MPRLDIVDIMHDNVVRLCFQYRVIDDNTVINFWQFGKPAIDNAVERVLIAPEDLRASYLFQPPEQLLGQLLPPPLSKIHQYHAGIKIAAILQTDTSAAFGFTPVTYSPQNSALQIRLPQRQDIALADDIGVQVEDFCYLGRQHFGK